MKQLSTMLRKFLLVVTCVIFMTVMIPVAPVSAAAPVITLDGDFTDWSGQMYINDPAGDALVAHRDIIAFYWANNPDDETCYWMLERAQANSTVRYAVFVDTNNNGNFREHEDRIVQVIYSPQHDKSRVRLFIRYADTGQQISTIYHQDWGESKIEGGRKVEFSASFADLGIGIGQTIRMYAISYRVFPFPGYHEGMEFEEIEEFLQGMGLDNLEDIFEFLDVEDLEELLGGMSFGELLQQLRDMDPEELENLIMNLLGNHLIDRVPDSGDIQWSPVSILGYPLLITLMVVAIICIWYFAGRKRWNLRR